MRTTPPHRSREPLGAWPVIGLALACTFPATDASAGERWFDWTIGVGTSYASGTYLDDDGRAEDPSAELEPYLELSAGPLTVSPLGASLTVFEWFGMSRPGDEGLMEDSPWEISADLFVDVDSGYRDQGEETVFADMDDRAADTALGLELDWFTPVGLFSTSVGTEIGGGSGGQSATLAWGVPLWSGERVEVFADVGVEWLSGDLVRHDYGVRANEVRVGRPRWEPGAALVPRASVGAEYGFRSHWSLFGVLDLSRRPGEIRDSPLTDDAQGDFLVEIGVLYSSD